MTPEEFIRKHITEKLMAEGFPLTVAQGGQGSDWTTTAACHRRARRGRRSTIASTAPECGRKGRPARLSARPVKNSVKDLCCESA